MPRKKSSSKSKKPARPRNAEKRTAAAKSKSRKAKATTKPRSRTRTARRSDSGGRELSTSVLVRGGRGLGAASGGQSGDVQGLSRRERYDSESVEELVEEGQALEAEAVSGVQDALDPDQGEVTTSEFPEDDVPGEYLDPDEG